MSRRCDCGRQQTAGANACRRCAWLDGRHPAGAEIISALRALGGVATYECLFGEIATREDRGARSRVQHAVRRLRLAGRLVVREEDGSQVRLLALRG